MKAVEGVGVGIWIYIYETVKWKTKKLLKIKIVLINKAGLKILSFFDLMI